MTSLRNRLAPRGAGRAVAAAAAAVTVVLASSAAHAQQQYRLQHTTSIPLGEIFFGPGGKGEPSSGFGSHPLNVAFDGTHAYVGGLNASGTTDMVGVVRVENALTSAPSLFGMVPTQFTANDTRGVNGLDYSPTTSSLVIAHDSGNSTTSFITNRSAANGAVLWTVTNPQNARPFALAIDPLGDNGAPGVAFLTQGSGRRRLLSLANGTTIFDGATGGIINYSPPPPMGITTWRGLDFDPQGNVALSSQSAVGYGLRVTNNQWSTLAGTLNLSSRSVLAAPDANFVGRGVAILDALGIGTSDLLAFSARTPNTGDMDFAITLTDLNGASEVADARDVHVRNLDGSTSGILQPTFSGNEDGIGGARWNSELKEVAFGRDPSGLPVMLVVSFTDKRLDTYTLEPTWNVAGGGLWADPANWLLGAVPNSPLANARFGEAITGPATITIDSPKTVKVLKLDNANPITFTGAGPLNLDSAGVPMIQVFQGDHTIGVPVNLVKDTQVAVPAANTLSVQRFSGAGLAINSGTVRIVPNGTAASTSKVTSLTLAGDATPTATLDITNNAFVVDYTGDSPLTTIKAQITHAYNNGAWDQPGITSENATSNTHGIGYAEAGALTSIPAIFGTVDDSAVLFRLTRYGDANLDGSVNLQDFNALAANFGGTDKLWHQGDFNYDMIVNLQDFNRLAANFGLQAGPDGPTPDDWAALASAVPEPGAVGLLSLALLPLLRRQRR